MRKKKITNPMYKDMLEKLFIEGMEKYKALQFLESRGMKWSTFHRHWERMEDIGKPERIWNTKYCYR